MKIIESILTLNPCYTAGRKITPKGLMLHSVGCPQPSASVFVKNWNKASYDRACVHGFIDANSGDVYHTLPWNHRGWHCGSGKKGSANNTHIGVEMCEPDCIEYTGGATFTCSNLSRAREMVRRTYESAVELFASLCKEYGLDPLADGVVISHKEGCTRGIASNHGDPEHLWTQLKMGYTMDGFRKAVKAAMGGVSPVPPSPTPSPSEGSTPYRVRRSWTDAGSQLGAFNVLENAKKMADANPGYAVFDAAGNQVYPSAPFQPYMVRVSISDLYIRSEPSKGSADNGFIPPGVYTIVEERPGDGSSSGWGRLKSGAGWIALDYAEKV